MEERVTALGNISNELGADPMVDRVVHWKYLGRSSLKAFSAQRLLEPGCEGIVCLTVPPNRDAYALMRS